LVPGAQGRSGSEDLVLQVGSYVPKTPFWRHQKEAFDKSAELPNFAYLMEQRVGKTKPCLDRTALWYERGLLDALVVVALPAGVHLNWLTDEIPAHLPDRIPRMCVEWRSKRASTKSFKDELDRLVRFEGLAVLAANGGAVITKAFAEFMVRFLKARRVHLVGDETSLLFPRPGTDRAKAMASFGRHPRVVMKSILDGTPEDESPFHLYQQFSFLSPTILGYTSFFAFKQRYGVWKRGYNQATQREYPILEEHQNLEELRDRIAPVSYRISRREAFPDMPEQVVSPLRFELSEEQARVYNTLADEYEAELRDGHRVEARHVLVRYLRLQQVASNFWPSERIPALCTACGGDGCATCEFLGAVEVRTPLRVVDPKVNPRLRVLEDQLTRTREPFIVWCRFTKDVDDAIAACARAGVPTVRYDGLVPPDEKAANKLAFQTGGADALVGNPTSGGRGLTLKRARTVFNYSGFFSLLVYLQGNDRGEDTSLDVRRGDRGTSIVNLLARGTVDEDMDEAHARKADVASIVKGRPRVFRRIET
jgi:hypothetical protein